MILRNLKVQRRLLLAVLLVIILLPIFLFIYATAMNRQLAQTAGERAVDQIMTAIERRKGRALERGEWEAFYWMKMIQRASSGNPLEPFPPPRSSFPTDGSKGAVRPYAPPELLISMPSRSGKSTTTLVFPLAGAEREMRKKILKVILQGGKLVLRPSSGTSAAPQTGAIPVAPLTEGIGDLVSDFARSNTRNLLKMSLVGAALLLGLGAYIVVLSERGRKLESQLERERGLAYVGTLAAGLAHEIRNPLSSVKMNVQMIEQKLSALDHDPYAYLNTKVHRILQETTRLEGSISDFLRFARPAPLQKEKVALNRLVDETVEFMAPECTQAGVEIVRQYADGLPPLALDSAQFSRALRNLIINARQSLSERGGQITLTTRRNGSTAEVTVADSGPGVSKEVRERLFDVFVTTKPDGTGLGLSIVKQIAEAHGGAVRLEQRPGPGAAFTLAVPL